MKLTPLIGSAHLRVENGISVLKFSDDGPPLVISWFEDNVNQKLLPVAHSESSIEHVQWLQHRVEQWLLRFADLPLDELLQGLAEPLALQSELPPERSAQSIAYPEAPSVGSSLLAQSTALTSRALAIGRWVEVIEPSMKEILALSPMREIAEFAERGLAVGHREDPQVTQAFRTHISNLIDQLVTRQMKLEQLTDQLSQAIDLLRQRTQELRQGIPTDLPSHVMIRLESRLTELTGHESILTSHLKSIQDRFLVSLEVWTGSLRIVRSSHLAGDSMAPNRAIYEQAIQHLKDPALIHGPTLQQIAR